MIAKTQFKLDQFITKQKLRRLLQKRSSWKREFEDKLTLEEKEDRAELDRSIKWARDFLEMNKCMLIQKKRAKRETVAA